MKMRIVWMALAMALSAAVGYARTAVQPQPANSNWIGVWQGQLDGQPAVILTLAERDGHLDGTAVFNMVVRQPEPHVIPSEPQMIVSPTIEGNTLHFAINAFPSKPSLQYEVKVTGDGTAHLKCLNCDGAPEADLVRAPVYPKRD